MNDDFIQTNTKFKNYEDMINQSGLELSETTAEELYLNEELKNFIKANTKFKIFKDMCMLAAKSI